METSTISVSLCSHSNQLQRISQLIFLEQLLKDGSEMSVFLLLSQTERVDH